MDQQRADHTIDDEALDREIESALAAEPSPEFLARVRARIAAGPAPSLWRPSWGFAGGLSLAGAVLLTVVFVRSERPRPPDSALPADPITAAPIAAVTPAGIPIAPFEPTTLMAAAAESSGRVRIQRSAAATAPAIVISPRDAAALRLLMANLREGRVDPSVLAALQEAAPPLEPLATVAIQPIAIEPLPRLALLEGERP
jgi:hypothetical protein